MSRSAKPCTNARVSAASEMSFEIHGWNAHRGVAIGGAATSSAAVWNRHVGSAASGESGMTSSRPHAASTKVPTNRIRNDIGRTLTQSSAMKLDGSSGHLWRGYLRISSLRIAG